MTATSDFIQTRSPVLFIIFNRPDTTAQVFNQIKKAKPKRLYIAGDGARNERPGETQLCEAARNVVNEIDWECDVKTRFQDVNLGCKDGVSTAISWFFEHEEEGIILEDDCLPADSFFSFCDNLLEKYRYDTRVRHITGCNLQQGKKWGDASYYFSNITHVWGWAGWRRVWKDYDKDLKRFDESSLRYEIGKIFQDSFILDSLEQIFKELKAGKIDTWDYQLGFLNYLNNGLCIIPNVNLISNLGFGTGSTHTVNTDSPYANLPVGSLTKIVHPRYFLPEKQADLFTLSHDFNIEERERRHNLLRRKVKRWVKEKLMTNE
ncbi:nucleotide-diphospho-sugar transferase [Mucilaginibacter xinganensis]|uniref:Nucleotide-diphospho-sugar transferase n=1 Tax=Mucilaginibacter xinganensis TaxID=1234841 RepID=A0A223P2U4_9SPHI|nr:nucleotide-diphospho-sugar transferase [Mucilaginibacter xinganensis]ASU36141.1 hypothetical protein MuYL_4256 [Mucilaginibacter xinganensis]